MGHKLKNLKMQMSDILQLKLKAGQGQSKKQFKESGTASDLIFSYNTFKTYKRACYLFAEYMKANHPECRTVASARSYADEWLRSYIDSGTSAYTQATYASALGKLYGEPKTAFVKTDSRNRVNLTRSRNRVKKDLHFSEKNNALLIAFCKSTGLRRNELEHCRGDFLIQENGKYFLDFTGKRGNYCKGGRPRKIPLINDIDTVVNLCKFAGDGLVFGKVSSACDVHSYRGDYACSIYLEALGDTDVMSLPRSQQYRCRGDLAGLVLSRDAMLKASKALGHNRIDVIAQSYLYKLKNML